MGKFGFSRMGVIMCVAGAGLGFGRAALADDYAGDLLGDAGGVRTSLGAHGVTINITDSENLLGNVAGGVKTGATLQGLTTGVVEVDTGKAFGLAGGTFHVSALQIHGQNLSPAYLDDLQTVNGNEAEDGTRLWELWYDQKLTPLFDIKLGQQSIDNEFITSANSALFVNTMAGWPLVPSDDLFGGGPAYPLSSPGVRLQAVTGPVTVLAGVFDDNPGGGAFTDDAQTLDRNGGRFNLNTGTLAIAELQYATKLNGLAGTYKFGGWYDTGHFLDQRFGTDGLSIAAPDLDGVARMHDGNYSLYGVVDQAIWKIGGAELNAFGRIMGAPDAQNLIDFSFNGGFTLSAPLPGRANDTAGVDFELGQVSRQAAALGHDTGSNPRGTEEVIELTYQAQATPWLVVQPDVQFVLHPGAGLADPDDPTHDLRDEIVIGARAVTTF